MSYVLVAFLVVFSGDSDGGVSGRWVKHEFSTLALCEDARVALTGMSAEHRRYGNWVVRAECVKQR
jgi:hypothetical protein